MCYYEPRSFLSPNWSLGEADPPEAVKFFRKHMEWFRMSLLLCVIALVASQFNHAATSHPHKEDGSHYEICGVKEGNEETREFLALPIEADCFERIGYNELVFFGREALVLPPAYPAHRVFRPRLDVICRYLL